MSDVAYITECCYEADVPYLSKEKSTYKNVIVIVANKDQSPEFAFKQAQGGEEDVVSYPLEIRIEEVETL